MSTPSYTFSGWMGLDKDAANGHMVWQSYTPKPWEETDIDIKISHCGVCASDLCVLRSGWRPTPYPCLVGHEIIGHITRIGTQVKGLQLGDRVGVGPQSDSCRGRVNGPCIECSTGNEKYCPNLWTGTYAGKYMDGSPSYGGYALYNRVPAHFAVKIPEGIESSAAAPMLCAGATVYAPLKQYGCGPGKRVGILGVGGLGHFGILFAKALGAERVVALSRSQAKREDALALGADGYIAYEEGGYWVKEHAGTLDVIISTVSSNKIPILDALKLLRANGTFVQVGNPENGPFTIPAGALIGMGLRFAGSKIGSPSEIRDMLELAVKKGVTPWIEERPMGDANEVLVDMDSGKARYRYVLVNRSE
ncbi:NAD(P)-dependent alcohol dehydrogenase [Aspergillus ibericus CBS 121593]|uniref:alcohol dehydrogenase (NADP(+)) n=1 Tax=Aspergillus ibericus CBS 121593 TaxID=1448316 RepID=A0A395GL86_9EURO|nr:GroES-like protein [Aspergillus ibericus CBS 121593]RAK96112.1 GroES-like protein [Aspergillus ibericus CBS 121593]